MIPLPSHLPTFHLGRLVTPFLRLVFVSCLALNFSARPAPEPESDLPSVFRHLQEAHFN